MYVVKTKNGKFKYCEEYKDITTGKWKTKSVTYDNDKKSTHRMALRELERRIADANVSIRSSITLGELYDAFLEDSIKHNKTSTINRNKSCIRVVTKLLGRDFIINETTIPVAYRKLKDASYRSKRVFNTALKYAYDHQMLDTLLKIRNPRPPVRFDKLYYEVDEVRAIINTLNEHRGYTFQLTAYIVEFLTLTGLRIGECLALTYADVVDGSIRINKSANEDGTIDTTKTASSVRTIGINKRASDILKAVDDLKEQFGIPPCTFIFSSEKRQPMRYLRLYTALHRCGISGRMHIFRHTHASLLAERGFSIDEIQRRLGHADYNITRQIYVHVTKRVHQADIDKFKNVDLM